MKTALTVLFSWMVVYLVVTLTLVGFAALGVSLVLPAQTFILTAVLVPSMVLVIGPVSAKAASKLCT
ncbi:DUF2798 domain-containing protein [Litorimonas haliclonae]